MKLRNKYYIMRHGQAVSNVKRLCSSRPEKFHNPLTEFGEEMVRESAEKFKGKLDAKGQVIDLIFCSPLLRTKQTAEIAGKILGVKTLPAGRQAKIELKLREIGFGKFSGKSLDSMWRSFQKEEDRVSKGPDGGESYTKILDRMLAVIKSVEKKYKDRNILLISHEGPLFLLQGWAMGLNIKETIIKFPNDRRIHKAEIRQLN